jgi:hypothetical protein
MIITSVATGEKLSPGREATISYDANLRSTTIRTGGNTTQSTTSNITSKLRSNARAKAMASLHRSSAMAVPNVQCGIHAPGR